MAKRNEDSQISEEGRAAGISKKLKEKKKKKNLTSGDINAPTSDSP